MITAIQSVLAVVLVIALGYFGGKKGIVSVELSKPLSNIVMTFTLPALLFSSVASSKLSDLLNIKFTVAFFLALMFIFFVVIFLQLKVLKRGRKVTALFAFGCSFPNITFMGIPYLTDVLGPGSLISVVIGNTIISVFMIPATIMLLEAKSDQSIVGVFKSEFLKLMVKPLIIAPLIGIIFVAAHIPVPMFLMHGLDLLGSATAPMALFVLGLMMVRFKFKISTDAVVNIVLKLLVQPLLAIVFVLAFGLSGMFAKEIIILSAMPTAAIISMFAESHDTYVEESVSSVIGSTVISVVTLVIFTVLASKF